MNGWLEIWERNLKADYAWLNSDSEPMKRRDRVKVLRLTGDHMSMLVEHPEHGQQTVACLGLDMPRVFKSAKGRWIPENDPRVEVFLLKALDDVRSGGRKIEASGDPDRRKATEEEILWLLERNGWGGEEIRLPGFQVEPSQA